MKSPKFQEIQHRLFLGTWDLGLGALLFLIPYTSFSQQKKLEKEKNKILAEGIVLYTLILANWTSNDLYYENEFNTGSVKGYLSYRDKDTIKTIFWRNIDTASAEYKAKKIKRAGDTIAAVRPNSEDMELRRVIKTVRYSNIIVSKKNASVADEEERLPTPTEKMLMDYRAMAYKAMGTDTSFFKLYAGTKPRVIPMDAGRNMKVFVYLSVTQEGIVPMGGDYLLVYDKREKKLLSKDALHKDCIFISTRYNGKSFDAIKSTLHTHKNGASPLITPTDIAALLLYKNRLEWDEHYVIADKYTCIFTLVDRKLDIMLTEDFEYLKKKMTEKENERKKTKMR